MQNNYTMRCTKLQTNLIVGTFPTDIFSINMQQGGKQEVGNRKWKVLPVWSETCDDRLGLPPGAMAAGGRVLKKVLVGEEASEGLA